MGILSLKVSPKPAEESSGAMLFHTQIVKCVEVSMFSSFLQGMLHMVRPSLGRALKAKEGSQVKAAHGVLMALLFNFKIPTINKLTELYLLE